MTTSPIVEKINSYLPFLTNEQREAVLLVVKAFAECSAAFTECSAVNDEFDAMVNRRLNEMENGTGQGVSWKKEKQESRVPYES